MFSCRQFDCLDGAWFENRARHGSFQYDVSHDDWIFCFVRHFYQPGADEAASFAIRFERCVGLQTLHWLFRPPSKKGADGFRRGRSQMSCVSQIASDGELCATKEA